jgi:polyisoprenoid-binding protein YceI
LTQKLLRIAILAATTMAISLPAVAATSEWMIDPAHSSAQFAVRHLAISTIRGAFTKVTGTVQLDDQDVTKSSVKVTIDADSVDTRVPDRDKDLRSERFFDVAKYPTITFRSKKSSRQVPAN